MKKNMPLDVIVKIDTKVIQMQATFPELLTKPTKSCKKIWILHTRPHGRWHIHFHKLTSTKRCG